MRNLRLLAVLLGLVLPVACRAPEPAADATSPPAVESPPAAVAAAPIGDSRPRVVFLGDSLTAGYGLAREESVPALVQQRLERLGYPHQVINAGVSGDTSAGGLSRLDWSLQGNVEVLVIELGGNDGLRGLPAAALKQNLETIITRAKARGIRVLLTGMEAPPEYGPAYTSEFRQVYRALAEEHQVAFMPFFLEGVAGIRSLNIADGIHPNAEGARIIEANIWRALEPLLEDTSDATD